MKDSVSLADLLGRTNRTAVTVATGIVFLATLLGSFAIGLVGLVETAHVQARVLAENAIPAIHFGDKRAAYELLGSLRHWPQVYAARLMGPDRRILATYIRNRPAGRGTAPAAGDDSSYELFPGALNIRQDIDNGDGWFGNITLTIGLGELYRQTAWIGIVTLVAALAGFAVSRLLLNRFKPSVLGPLQGLNRLMAKAYGQSDFPARARESHIVEIDALGRGFNEMIGKIQDRDRQLARLAYSDMLTGLPNRSAFMDRLEREVQRASRSGHRLGLLFLDLDGFKRVNDTLGHDVGDRLLVEAAARIREALRPSDATGLAAGAANDNGAARLGGDEFTVLAPDLREIDDVMIIARRIGDVLRQPFLIAGHGLAISGSIGAAVFPDHARDAPELPRHADAAMYQSKRSGRDNSRLFGASVADPAKATPPASSKLHAAIS